MKTASYVAAALAAFASSSAAFAHGNSHGIAIGEKGDPSHVSRTINVTMNDNVFLPDHISIRAGETVRFVVRNEGEMVHEFNIGTAEMHAAHGNEMMAMIESGVLEADRINHALMDHKTGAMKDRAGMMKHEDPNAVLLEPGKSGEVVWTFPKSASLQFACNVPGHYEDGMVGDIRTERSPLS